MPAFRIFPDRTLFALAEARPASENTPMAVTGVGPRLARLYGPALLKLLAAGRPPSRQGRQLRLDQSAERGGDGGIPPHCPRRSLPESSTAASPSELPKDAPPFISGSFAAAAIDRNVWGWYGTNQADSVALSFSQRGGALNVSVSSTAANDFNASLGTRCKVRGDFDATLSYRLVEWPASNGVWVSLMAADTGGFNVYRVSWQFGNGEAYGAYLPPAGTAVAASGDLGVLRLARQGSTWTGYYLLGRHWIPIASGVGPTDDVALSPAVFDGSNATSFGGAPTHVAFDSFQASAARVVCP